MNRTRLGLAILTLLVVGTAEPAAADWNWRSWIPFSQDRPKASKKKSTSSRIPLLDGRPLNSKSSGPSMMQRMGRGTKRFFGAAKDTLTFTDSKPEPRQISGQTTTWRRGKDKPKEESSWFGGWFGQEKEPPRAETVGEWISQDRVDF